MTTYANHIDGAWRTGATSAPDHNPSDVSDVVGEFARADAAQAEEAVASAAAARHGWARTMPGERFDVLDRAGSEIAARAEELGELLSREEGKTRTEGVAEARRAAQLLKFHAGQALRNPGEHLPSVRPGVEVVVSREPVGVVSVITPWNFPLAIPAWKIAPALAYGNTVVFKPADLVPASAWHLVDILQRAGLPPGVLNLVMGRGSEVGDVLTGDPRVDAVSFTGSTATGRRILTRAQEHGAEVQLEMGGKNPLVVLDDADLDVAVAAALEGAFGSTGQRCTASSRIVVTHGVHDELVERLRRSMAALTVGHALDPSTTMGPVVDETQLAQDLRYIDVATQEGASLVGGTVLERPTRGHFLSPALLVDTDRADTINREEVFGPVASVVRVADLDEAIDVANDTEFGLTAGICTSSLSSATRFRRDSTAGMVMVNLPTAGVDPHVSFGGRGASSYGPKEQGPAAREFYTVSKTAYIAAL